ncbi:hypothetical protein CTZ27_15245 [Streptomyces griseocarneus]|nr:hypothetical protein CTZ27_15245 [Streptomyces griseocarneus]
MGPPWRWVPLFDALYSMRQIILFAEGADALGRIDFTENDEFIDFKVDGSSVRVSPSYLDIEVSCTVNELAAACQEFIRAELQRVTLGHPSLTKNPQVSELAREIGLHPKGAR